MDTGNLRETYKMHTVLERSALNDDPFVQFQNWFQNACDSEVLEPNAMILATVNQENVPQQRTVLMKLFDHTGFVFFTNYQSRKARDITGNANVSLLFPWYALQRQVCITGTAQKMSTAESIKYFATRPRGSQLGAWCSVQSAVIPSRTMLNNKLGEIKQMFTGKSVTPPPYWGGFRVVPVRFEFWQGQANRLHDRFLYQRDEEAAWQIDRLAP